jgi:hypothetical protein
VHELPTDVWRLIMARLAETDDLRRSASEAARDIAAAACICRTASEAAGAGWRELQSAHVGWVLSDASEGGPSDISEQQWYDDAQRFEQVRRRHVPPSQPQSAVCAYSFTALTSGRNACRTGWRWLSSARC